MPRLKHNRRLVHLRGRDAGKTRLELVLPDGLGIAWAGALVAASFVTAAISAAFGIGGGVAMLAVMLAVLPPAVVLPIHGVVQAGSNAGRVVTLRKSVQRSMLSWFSAGTVAGIIVASLVLVALPTQTLQVILGVFILWTVWGPKLAARRRGCSFRLSAWQRRRADLADP